MSTGASKPEDSGLDLLPHPDLLQHYIQIFGPDDVRKLTDEVVATLAHRRAMQASQQMRDYELQCNEQKLQARGQLFAFIVAFSAIGGGIALALVARDAWHIVSGSALSGGTVVSIVVAFLKGRQPPPATSA